ILVGDGRRDQVKSELLAAGVGCAVYYPLSLHLQKCFAHLGGKAGDYPVSEKVSGEILALPIYPESTTEQREYVVS
ncbi:MAG: DegT/DnrJ/EryC1/StrS family aminotransferase, partial [Victivallaceae bacterium]